MTRLDEQLKEAVRARRETPERQTEKTQSPTTAPPPPPPPNAAQYTDGEWEGGGGEGEGRGIGVGYVGGCGGAGGVMGSGHTHRGYRWNNGGFDGI